MNMLSRHGRHALAASLCLCALSLPALAQPAAPGLADAGTRGRALMREEKYAEAADAFKEHIKVNPYSGPAWGDLGYSLHAVKRWDEAIPAYAKAVELGWRPETQMYNTACAHALSGRKDEALTWLKKSLEHRFAEQQTLETDTDMDSLRADPRFIELTGLNAPTGLSPEQQWAWDLSFMVRRMEQMHWDLYGKAGKAEFNAAVDKLKAEAPRLPASQVRVRLAKILAMVGDGHTHLGGGGAATGETTAQRIPLDLFLFADGLHVIGAPPEHEGLIGARVLNVGSLDAAAAVEAVKPYISVDNPMGYSAIAPGRLVHPAFLVAIGAAPDEQGARYTMRLLDGSQTEVTIAPVETPVRGHGGLLKPGFKYLHSVTGKTPLYLEEAEKTYLIRPVPGQNLVYARFAGVVNRPEMSLADFADGVIKAVEENNAERLVIDMRFNGGGNTGLLRPLFTALIGCEQINQPGRLFVIIGRHTFSAAQNCVNMMEDTMNVTFVGEPTGSCPAFIGESTFFVLPYSQLRVTCSSRYWQWGDSTDQRIWVAPHLAAPPTFAAYLAGKDDAMDAITTGLASQARASGQR